MNNRTNVQSSSKAHACRSADGHAIAFRDDPHRMILTARGPDARTRTEDLLARARIETTPWSTRHDPHQISVLAHLPRAPRQRRRVLAALRDIVGKQLPRANLIGQLAAPILVGDRIDGLTAQLIVRFAPHVTPARVAEIARSHGLAPVRAVPYAGNCYVLTAGAVPCHDLIETQAKLAADPDVVHAEHDVVTIATKDVSDFLLPEQHDLNMIGCPGAWARMPGSAPAGSSAITVAVIDPDGIDPAHPDLSDVLGDGKPKQRINHDFVTGAAQASGDLLGSHGTQCAATAVGGFDNATGTAGVAGDCHLVAARISDTPSILEIADAWLWAAGFPSLFTAPMPARLTPGADVILNSWGIPGPLPELLRAVIDFVTTFGRGGRGCVMCFSAGNDGTGDFAMTRAAAAYERTIGVGASINKDPTPPAQANTRALYSPYGELDLVAPSSTTVGEAPLDPTVSATRVGFGAWTSDRAFSTGLSAPTPSPASTITVDDVSGFKQNDRILIGVPGQADREFSMITKVHPAVRTLDLAPALTRPHGSATEVSTGPNDHDRTAGGTSHATALVAGAAAIVLSIRPELTWRDVREILRRSATRIDLAQADPVGQWVDRDGDGVREFSRWYGYGRLDVEGAVQMAGTYPATDAVQVIDIFGAPPMQWPVSDAACCAVRWPCWLGLAGSIAAVATSLVLGICSGRGDGALAAPSSQACDLPRRARGDSCPSAGCGSNSGYLSGFVIDGLSIDGCRNYDGVRVIPDSLRPGSRCASAAMKLGLSGGELVGLGVATDEIVCNASDLGGATFTVEGPAWALGLGNASDVRTRDIRIGATGLVAAWNLGTPELVRTYAFEGASASDSALCTGAQAWLEDWWDTTPSPSFDATTPTPTVLVVGELYNPKSAQIKLRGTSAGGWFNIACAGGALSKMRLMGLDPSQSSSTADERQATLKMLTAKYCGATTYTRSGMPLQWTSSLSRTDAKATDPRVGPIEARWTARGASCISHSRAWRSGLPGPTFPGVPDQATEAGLIALIRASCQIPTCAPSSAPDPKVYWTTHTVNHIDTGP